MRKLILLLLLLALPMAAQVPNPQVPFSGRIGPGGNFPLFNGGTIQISGNYTMTFPDMTASVIRFTGTLSATATITAPNAQFGYEFTIQNATSGNQSIVFRPATGSGVTIPNGQAVSVIYDGTNYVSVGSAGGGAVAPGYNVPANYPTVQGAINAASAAGSGPVAVMPEATDRTPYTNPNGVRVTDYRQRSGIDTRFSRDVSEWGVRGDGKVVTSCTTTANSNVINCPAANFQPTDANKLAIVYNAGPPSGAVNPDVPVTIVSAPTGAPNWYYPGINTDSSSGCDTVDTQPYVWFRTDGTGTIVQQGWAWTSYGVGCTHAPTTWTLVNGPSGTVTTSGGAIFAEDQPTTITAVNSPTQITVADNMTVSTTTQVIYGTDDKSAWTTACNAMKDVAGAASNYYSHGTLTFTGTSLVSAGVDCNGSNTWIIGSGYLVLGESNASLLVYAGKTTGQVGGGYLMRLTGGQGMRLTRMGFRGNTFAQPYLLVLAFGPVGTSPAPGTNVGTATTGLFEDISFGWMYGDAAGVPRPGAPYSSQSCVFADTNVGNVDFESFDRIYCRGALVGVDGNNNQATAWEIGIWHSENNRIGYALGGTIHFVDYYTEHNWLDVMLGSPTNTVWNPVSTVFQLFEGESSAQMIRMSPLYNSANLVIHTGGGNIAYTGPHGNAIDLSRMNNGVFRYEGDIPGKLVLARGCYGGPDIDIDTPAPYASTVQWWNTGWAANCTNLTAPHFKYRWRGAGDASNAMQTAVDSFPNGVGPSATLVTDTMGAQQVYGSIKVSAATAPGDNSVVGTGGNGINNYITATAIGGGSTSYRYQITCKDGIGRESTANPNIITLNNASPLVSGTNYNQIQIQAHRGCASYCYYGDEGSGGIIGQLACIEQTVMASGIFQDFGQYTPNTAVTPPTVSQSGLIESAGLTILAQPFAGFKAPLVTTYYTQGLKLSGSQYLSDFSGKKAATGLVPIFDGTQYVPGSVVPPTQGVVSSLAGVASQGGYTTIGYSTQSGAQIYNYAFYQGFTPAAAPPIQALKVVDVKSYIGTLAGGRIYAAIYDSNGIEVNTGTAGAPGTLLCGDPTGTVTTASAWNVISSLDVTTCPYLTVGHKYFVAVMADDTNNVMFHVDGLAIDGNSFYNTWVIGLPCCFFRLDANYSTQTSAHYSQYVDLTTVPTFGTFDASHPIPSSYLGSGTTGTGTNCLTDTQVWAPCSAGTGGSMTYPGAGIPSSSGSTWNQSYNTTTNQIPAGYISTLNQNTTGNAATATALAAPPGQCSGGQFATGITATGTANCAPPSNAGVFSLIYTTFTANIDVANTTVGNVLQTITMVTPSVNTYYRFEVNVKQTLNGSCTTFPSVGIRLTYTDGDTSTVPTGNQGGVYLYPANGGPSATYMALTAAGTTGQGTASYGAPVTLYAKGGTPVQMIIWQQLAAAGCTTNPQILVRPVLYQINVP